MDEPRGFAAKLARYLETLASGGRVERPCDHIATGLAAYQAGDTAKATMALTMGLVEQPLHLEARVALARLALAAREFRRAEAEASVALTHYPRDPALHTLLGEILHASCRYDAAEPAYRTALRLDEKCVEAHLRLGILQFDMNELDKALASLEKAIFLNQKDASARYYIAQICLEHEDFKRALIQSHWAEKADPSFRPIYLLRADIFEHLGDWRNAAAELYKLDDMGMADAEVYCRLGHAQLELDAPELAVRAFQRAVEVQWHNLEARFQLARLHERAQRVELAIAGYRMLLDSKTYAAAAKEGIGRLETQVEQIDENLTGTAPPAPTTPAAPATPAVPAAATPSPAAQARPRLADLVGPPKKAPAARKTPLPPPKPAPQAAEPPAADPRAQMLQMQLMMAMMMELSKLSPEGEPPPG